MTRPPNLKELEAETDRLNVEKEEAVASQEFERAADLRDRAERLRQKKEAIHREWLEKSEEVEGVVDEEVVAEVVSSMTGVPLTRLESEEAERLLHMEEELHKTVISQDEAIATVARAVRRSRSGLKDPNRPMGVFLFLGPTGVGKTLLAQALAKFMFGEPEALIQIDMSEYMEKFNISRLIGAPPGYVGYEEGGQLTEKIRHRPYAVVCLDEIEKAHPDVFNMLLQIMEEGRLTDSFGRNVDFRNTILIMTSNIGAELLRGGGPLGFGRTRDEQSYETMKQQLLSEVNRQFRPEFLNRLDDTVVFRNLVHEDLAQIVDLEMARVRDRLSDRGVHLELSQEAKTFLIDRGYSAEFGARPLKRTIERLIEDPLSEEILRGSFQDNDTIVVRVRDDHLVFEAGRSDAATDLPQAVEAGPAG